MITKATINVAALLLLGVCGAANAIEDTILILDASGSMWGQIDGVNKIVIAKDVVEELAYNLPPEQRLGFVAYGHRREGDCKDIETLADVGAPRDELIGALRGLTAKGKTPLSNSVEHAAAALNYKKQAATVILVSDGLENCAADPCALAKSLEQNGLDFTVHVVGFDVTVEERRGLACIASETGGQFLTADTASELTQALSQVTIADSTPAPSEVVLKATVLPGGPQIQSKLDWIVTLAGGGDPVFSASDSGSARTAIEPGAYRVQAVWHGWRDGSPKQGAMDIEIREQNTHVYTVPIDLGLPLSLETPEQVVEGHPVDIAWSGPDDLGTQISVNRLDDAPNTSIFFFAGAKARADYQREAGAQADSDGDGDSDQDDIARAVLGAPIADGDYEIRYVLRDPLVVLARRPLTVSDGGYSVAAPASAPVSTQIEIQWSGALTRGDAVTLVPRGDERVFDNARYRAIADGQSVRLTTPKDAGEYEIRYVMVGGYTTYPGMSRSVQASVPIVVTDVSASVSGPATAVGGSTVEVGWTGPAQDWEDDFVSVVAVGAEKYNRDSWAKISKGNAATNPTAIRVPAIEGEYELVYVIAPGNRIVARQPLSITRAQASVDAPPTVKAGQDFEVGFAGDGFKGDRVVVVKADYPDAKMWGVTTRYGFVADAAKSSGTVRGEVVAEPGDYEVRYVTGLQHQILARDAFSVAQ